MKKVFLTLSLLATLGLVNSLQAQDSPAPSPTAEITEMVGLTKISLRYARPGMKGRTIFAKDGLVPFGKIWRTGANQATKISFSTKVMMGDATLEAGDYAILSKPGSSEWEVMFFTFEGEGWGGYREKTPAATVMAKASTDNRSVETFTININDVRDESATLNFIWENTVVSLPFSVEKTW